MKKTLTLLVVGILLGSTVTFCISKLIKHLETGKVETVSTYSNTTWGILFTYPNHLKIVDRGSITSAPLQISLMDGDSPIAGIKVHKDAYGGTYTDEGANQNLLYLDQEPTGDIQWGNQPSKRFDSDGYCDGGGCSDPYVAIAFVKNHDQYEIVFPGDKILNATEEALLGSFEFSW